MKILLAYIFIIFSWTISAQSIELANSYFVKGEYEKAIQIYRPLFDSNPIRQDYFKSLLTCYQQLEKYKEAQSLVEEQLQRFPNQIYLYVELGKNYQLQGLSKLAETKFEKAISYIYEQPGYGFMVGRSFRQNHLLDYALRSYKLAKELNPKLNTEISEAQIYGEKGDLEKMFNLYLDLLSKNLNYYATVQRNIAKFIKEDKNDTNNLLFKKLLLQRAQNDPKDSWNILLSWLFMQQLEYNKALTQEKSLFKRNPGRLNRIQEIGLLSYENNSLVTSTRAFQYIIDNANDTSIDPTIILQADMYLLKIENKQNTEKQDRTLIKEKYKALISKYGISNETIELQLDYATFLSYYFDQPELAIEHLENLIPYAKSVFEKGRIQMEIADMMVFSNQFNQALILYSKIQTNLKNSVLAQEARFKVARTSYFEGDFIWAQNQLKVLKSSTSQLIANDALELSLKISNNIEEDSLNEALLYFAKAELLAFQNKNKQAIDTISFVLKNFKGQKIEDDALYKQAVLFEKEADYLAAEQNFMQILNHHLESVLLDDAIFNLALLYQHRLNNPKRAKEMYEKIIFEFPSSIYLVDSRKAFRKLRGDEI